MRSWLLLLVAAVSTRAQDKPELGVPGSVCAPIQHRAFWRLEPELFGYRPRFVPGVVTFGPENRPYIRDRGAVQTLDRDGKWVRLDFAGCVQRAYPKWDGKFSTGAFAEEHVVFDRRSGKLSEPVFLGVGGTGRPDNHNLPAIAADGEGYLHVLVSRRRPRTSLREPGAC